MSAQDEESGFSFLTLFAVTGISGFGFSMIVKILDDYYPPVFTWMGIAGLTLAALTLLFQPLFKRFSAPDKKRKHNGSH